MLEKQAQSTHLSKIKRIFDYVCVYIIKAGKTQKSTISYFLYIYNGKLTFCEG